MTIKESRKRLKPIKKTTSRATGTKAREGKRVLTKPKSSRPIASFAGMWADDETFDEFVAAIAANRKAIDADTRQP